VVNALSDVQDAVLGDLSLPKSQSEDFERRFITVRLLGGGDGVEFHRQLSTSLLEQVVIGIRDDGKAIALGKLL